MTIDPIELVEFTLILALNSWKVFADGDALLGSNGETHFYVSANDRGTLTLETNERNAFTNESGKRNSPMHRSLSGTSSSYLGRVSPVHTHGES